MNIKLKERERKSCYSYLTFGEILFKFTESSEKFIAENHFLSWFIRNEKCKNRTDILNDTIRVCNLFLNNEFISSNTKKEIFLYLNQTKQ